MFLVNERAFAVFKRALRFLYLLSYKEGFRKKRKINDFLKDDDCDFGANQVNVRESERRSRKSQSLDVETKMNGAGR